MFGKKKNNAFISYRNKRNHIGEYENYNLVKKIGQELIKPSADKLYFDDCFYIPPEKIPDGTIFRPYDISKFLYDTFTILDKVEHFLILDKDYYTKNNYSSYWIEAENFIWSYYDKKEKFIYNINVENNCFTLEKNTINPLNSSSRALFRRISLDFNPMDRSSIQLFYKKSTYRYVLECFGCGIVNLINQETLNKRIESQVPFKCNCGNQIKVGKFGSYFIQNQISERKFNSLSIDDILALILTKDSDVNYPII